MIVDLEKIKSLRENKGFSVAEVSEHLGFKSSNGYYYKEAGRTELSGDEVGALAALFGVPVNDLYKVSIERTE